MGAWFCAARADADGRAYEISLPGAASVPVPQPSCRCHTTNICRNSESLDFLRAKRLPGLVNIQKANWKMAIEIVDLPSYIAW